MGSRHQQIYLRRSEARVTQQLLHHPDICAPLDQGGGKVVVE
tara:strand:- start:475 stop:600 length:126 start_codon:yes stop_codon:yes gene_type:complete